MSRAQEQAAVRRGLRIYAEALVHSRLGHPLPGPQAVVEVDAALRPGGVGQIVALHAREGVAFEAVVVGDLAEFVRRDDQTDRIWIAREREGVTAVGSIAVELSHSPRDRIYAGSWSGGRLAARVSGGGC